MGLAYAFWRGGGFSPGAAAAVLGLAALTQLGGTYLDDYFDHRSGVDWKTQNRTSFSGGGGLIQSGTLKPNLVLFSGILFLLGAALLATGLVLKRQNPSLAGIYLFGLLSGIFYTAPPLSLAYRGWGEVLIAANYGATAAELGYASQTGSVSFQLFLVSWMPSSLVLAVVLLHQMLDYEADRAAGKKGWVVRTGIQRSKKLFRLFLLFPFGLLPVLIGVKVLPFRALLPLAAVAWGLVISGRLKTDEHLPDGILLSILTSSFRLYIVFGLALTVGLGLDSLMR